MSMWARWIDIRCDGPRKPESGDNVEMDSYVFPKPQLGKIASVQLVRTVTGSIWRCHVLDFHSYYNRRIDNV